MSEQINFPARATGLAHLAQLAYMMIHHLIIMSMPAAGVGPFWGYFFKLPLLQYRLGLGGMLAGKILILTTTGRKSGLKRQTPLEYGYDAERDVYSIAAGWGGRSDWFRNLKKDPVVHIQMGAKQLTCRAEILPLGIGAQWVRYLYAVNPFAGQMFSCWIGERFDGSDEHVLAVAHWMPLIDLHPIEKLG